MRTEDKAKGSGGLSIRQKQSILEKAIEKVEWKVARYASEADKKAKKVYSEAEAMRLFKAPQFSTVDGNVLLQEGINELWTLVCSGSGTAFDNSNAYLGVGSSSTAEDSTQTGLQGASSTFVGMEAGYPTYGSNYKAEWKASFGSGEGNHDWEEFTVTNGGSNADKNLNRKTSSEGTKTSGQTWDLTLSITLS